MAVVFQLILILPFVKATNVSVVDVYKACYMSASNILSWNKVLPSSSELPKWCLTMRHDIAPCIAKELSLEDDGSISSRGNVLLHSYQKSGDDKIKMDVKLYHYGCLYNSWHYFLDEKCYNNMLRQCVEGNDSCYYKPCKSAIGYKSIARIPWMSNFHSYVSSSQSSLISILSFLITFALYRGDHCFSIIHCALVCQ